MKSEIVKEMKGKVGVKKQGKRLNKRRKSSHENLHSCDCLEPFLTAMS